MDGGASTAPMTPRDCALAWEALSDEVKRRIGTLAVGRMMIGRSFQVGNLSNADSDRMSAAEAAIDLEIQELGIAILANEPNVMLPALEPLGIQSCRVCGCTGPYGCQNFCWWAAPGLCSNCEEDHG